MCLSFLHVRRLVALVSLNFIVSLPSVLAKEADVELAVKLDPQNLPQVQKVFNLNQADSNARVNYFFDTDHKDLSKHGVIYRARISKNKVQLTIKSRPANQNLIKSLPESLRNKLECEKDRGFHIPDEVLGCSLASQITLDAFLNVINASSDPLTLLDQDQMLMVNTLIEGENLDAVYPYGPIRTNTWKDLTHKGLDTAVTVEVWWLPLNRVILEVSTRSIPQHLPHITSDLSAFFKKQSLTTIADFTKADYVLAHYRELKSQEVAQEAEK